MWAWDGCRDALLLQEQLNQREMSEESYRHKADELEKEVSGDS